ncbi:Uu.00g075820.m01.CDS01 [Anthostomella pinea]|uniref:Uu.00g075820.m01.CDS01 n=1 Tax=Anthostomella pinea TaxID=933095 RepID=A0AAI8YLS5_9PEZI|nr:Uu.00g075820.m01.CDS01 [Anthostomella pinea]
MPNTNAAPQLSVQPTRSILTAEAATMRSRPTAQTMASRWHQAATGSRRSRAPSPPARIMALGASLVRGEQSTDLTGFRRTMRDELVALGVPVNMVGSQRFGDMLDNDLEAYGGNRVSQIHEHATHIVPQLQPNMFIIQVGTNNVLQDLDVDKAGEHIEDFINYLLDTSPLSTVPKIMDVNKQYRDLVSKFENKAVLLAEMHPSEGYPDRPEIGDIGPDGSHPTNYGYELMGHIFAESIKEADGKGYLRWPDVNGLEYDGEAGRADATVSTTELPPMTTSLPSSSATSTIPAKR